MCTAMARAAVNAKYTIERMVVISSMIRSVVKVCYSLFEKKTIKTVPADTQSIAITSFLGTNFSPRNFLLMKALIRIAVPELQAIRVKSQKGSAMK